MNIVRNPFSFDNDLNQVRRFLLDIFKQSGSLHYLIPTKVENQKYGPCGPDYSPMDDEVFSIWRVSDKAGSDIIAVSHRGSAANYHIEVNPSYKNLERELFGEIEKLERSINGGKSSRMFMYTVGPDSLRATVLTELDYEDYGLHEYNYEFSKGADILDNSLPPGYMIRDLTNEEDYPKFVEVVGSVYDHCCQFMTLEKMIFMTQAEFFHPDLNLVVVDDTDMFVGFCMYRLDPLTGITEMEALGVRPNFQDLGLEEALLSEGLRRVAKHSPNLICAVEIDTSDLLNQLLESAGFTRSVTMNMWGKHI
ncbi:GNAT family N-acetyltransferase [Candidatus Thorarchaeota archaeon]|nr:MAG: GNAT family N-acetyltransferase [Candidatus Thorarchaeota archaeon]